MSAGQVTGEDAEKAAERERFDYSAGLRHAEAAYAALVQEMAAVRPDQRAILKQTADAHARLAITYSQRDLARSNRQLAESNDRLAASYELMVDEMRLRRGVASAA